MSIRVNSPESQQWGIRAQLRQIKGPVSEEGIQFNDLGIRVQEHIISLKRKGFCTSGEIERAIRGSVNEDVVPLPIKHVVNTVRKEEGFLVFTPGTEIDFERIARPDKIAGLKAKRSGLYTHPHID